jgi:SSS family transporter
MGSVGTTFLIVAAIYFLGVLGISLWGLSKTRTEEDFIAAGRTIGPWVGGAVLTATQISAGTFVGTIGRHYLTGVSWWYIWFGVWAGWLVSAFFVAPRLRRFGALTVPDYVATRFGSKAAGALAGALIVIAYTIYLVAQYQAAGEVALTVFGIRPLTAMLILVASTAFYTLLGGVRSSSYIDFVQTLIMVAALLAAVPVLLHYTGGLGQAKAFLDGLDPRLTGWYYGPRELIAFAVSFGFSIAAAPYEMTRFNSMRDERTVKQAIYISIGFQMIIGLAALSIGMLMRVLFPNLTSQDVASAVMAFEVLPPIVGALLLIALLSAIMSTVNSILLVVGAGVAHDLYGKLFRPAASQSHLVFVNRLAMAVLAAIPIWFALQKYGDVQAIVVEQTKFIASFFFVPVVIGLNWRRGTAAGAIAAMLGGFLACLTWEFTGQRGFASHGIDAVEVGVVVSLGLFVAVSRWTKPVPEANLRVFF